MVSECRPHGVHLLVLSVLVVGADAFVHPGACAETILSGRGFGDVVGTTTTTFYPTLSHQKSCLSHEHRNNVVLNEGLSLLDQVITTSIFAAGVYATILKADSKDAEESAAVVVADPTPASAPSAQATTVAVPAEIADPNEMSSPPDSAPEVSDTPKESGKKRRLFSKVVKKLVMPWRSFDDL